MTVHNNSIATLSLENTGETALNTQQCMPLSLTGLKAGVSLARLNALRHADEAWRRACSQLAEFENLTDALEEQMDRRDDIAGAGS